jgi:hypothetical protein
MKRIFVGALTLALLAAGVPRRAEAGDNERAFVAGVIGGAALHHAVTRSHPRVTTRYVPGSSYGSTTGYPRASYVHSARSNSYLNERVEVSISPGYHQTRHVKVWVPGYRQKYRKPCGTWVVRQVPGYYEVRPERVRVESQPYRHRRSTRRVLYTR